MIQKHLHKKSALHNRRLMYLQDQYVISCMVIQCVIAILNTIGGKMSKENQEKFDAVSLCVLGGIVVILHVAFGVLLKIKVIKDKTKVLFKT